MIKNIIFDMGGVIVDVHRDRAIQHFQSIGLKEAHELIDSYHHQGPFLALEDGEIDAETFRQELIKRTGKSLSMEDITKAWKSIISKPELYKLAYILELRKHYKVYLLSNNNPILIDWACTSDFSEAQLPITAYFDKLYVSYEMKCTKPGRKIYEIMIQDSGMIPQESLFIDDGIHNIETANELGFQTYHAQNGSDWRKDLDQILQNENKGENKK